MIGGLLYLAASMPDITFDTGVCARFQSDPWDASCCCKRIIKYIHSNSEFGVLYSYDTNGTLVGYCNTD